jgi:NAD(P)-dependent dehydrogenase (short-subunit alcohol dehydrogenase family)
VGRIALDRLRIAFTSQDHRERFVTVGHPILAAAGFRSAILLSMEMKGKTALITGSGGEGSGRAIACQLAALGAKVIVSDINESGGRETVRRIEATGGTAAFYRADVQVEQQVRDLIGFAETQFGGLHVLVNNASGPAYRPDQPFDLWNEIIQTDLLGTVYATRQAIDAMRRVGGGAIVNISSISALWHGRKTLLPAVPAYDAAKAGVLRLTTMLAWLGQENIRVNCLAPGWIASPPVRAYWEPLTPDQRKERGAPSRLLSVDEVAEAIVHLATDESLSGRILVWWSEDAPRLIPWGDPGYAELLPAPTVNKP